MTQQTTDTKMTIGSREFPVRFSYAYVFECKEYVDDDGNKTLKRSVMVLVPKADKKTVAEINAKVDAAAKAEFGAKMPAMLKRPLRDGDAEADDKGDYLKGHWFFNASSVRKVDVVGTEKDEFTDKLVRLGETDFKSGDYGRVTVEFYGFSVKGNKGVAVGLRNIQKLADGEPLGNTSNADADFAEEF